MVPRFLPFSRANSKSKSVDAQTARNFHRPEVVNSMVERERTSSFASDGEEVWGKWHEVERKTRAVLKRWQPCHHRIAVIASLLVRAHRESQLSSRLLAFVVPSFAILGTVR